VHEDGRRKWYRSKIYPVPTGILSISADVTERILVEEELHRQGNLLRSTLNSLINGVFILNNVKPDPDSRLPVIVDCNTAALRIFGYDRNEIIGKPPSVLYSSNEAFLEFRRLLFSAVESGQLPFNLAEFQMKRKDGTVFTAERTVDRLLNDKGEETGWVTIIRDITERKRLENELKQQTEHLEELVAERTAKLKESEERYRSVIENIPYVVWVHRDKKTVYMSQNVTKILGYEPDEIITNDFRWKIKIHPDDLTKVDATLHDLFAHNTPFDIEYRVQRKDGKWIWLHERAVSNIEMEGAHYTYGIFSDVTERKKLEEELRSAREQLEYAVFSNPAVIYVGKPTPDFSDFDGTFISKSVSSVLGYEPEQFIGESGSKFWQSHLPVEDRRKYMAEIPLLWRNGQHVFEYRFLHKDGKYRWIREEQRVIRNAEGRVRDVVGYWVDITERKKLEEELRSAKKQLEYVVTANPAVIYVAKPLPDLSDFGTTYISENVFSLLGFESRDFVVHPEFWTSRIHPDDVVTFKQKLSGLWKNGRQTFEYRFLCKNEKYRWIREETTVVRDAAGEPQDIIGNVIDISEQKKLEEALRTSEQNLRKANENLELGIVETTEQIESIARLREKLRRTPDLSTGLEMVLETIIWELGMEIGAIFAFDREKGLANLQALKTQSENMTLQQTYPLNDRFIEFEATRAKNIVKLVAQDDNSLLKTKSVYSTPIIITNEMYGVLTLGSNKTEKLADTDLIILEFYTELISQTITERRLTVKPVRERDETKAPSSWPAPVKRPELELGNIYLTKNQSFAYEIFSKFVLAGSEGLCVTREHPTKMRKRLGLEKTPIVWLTGEAFPNEHTIGSLQDLSITLGDFLQKAERPIVMLDGFEYLITNHTFESFLKFLQIIRDRIQSHNAILIAPITEKAFEPRTLGLIERETTILEPKA
jgi:PAS domain S-box-containing protein